MQKEIDVARERFAEIMRRHFRPEDSELDDATLVALVHARYLRERQVPIIDPNE